MKPGPKPKGSPKKRGGGPAAKPTAPKQRRVESEVKGAVARTNGSNEKTVKRKGKGSPKKRPPPQDDFDAHEDICDTCNKPGELLLCDKEGCSRVFHLGCLEPPLTEVPEGDFICPRCVEESHEDKCATCRKGSSKKAGELLMCDTEACPLVYHMGCVEPPLTEIPEGDWFCPKCVTERKKKAAAKRRKLEKVEAEKAAKLTSPLKKKLDSKATTKSVPAENSAGPATSSKAQSRAPTESKASAPKASTPKTAQRTQKKATTSAKKKETTYQPVKVSGDSDNSSSKPKAKSFKNEAVDDAVVVLPFVPKSKSVAAVVLTKGAKVEAEFDNEGWVVGTVTAVRADGGVDVKFDADGYCETYDREGAAAELRLVNTKKKGAKAPDYKALFAEEITKRTLFDNTVGPGNNLSSSDWKIGQRIEAVDQTSHWFKAKIVALKQGETGVDEVKVHFIGFKPTYDTWYSVDSPLLRQSGQMERIEKAVTKDLNAKINGVDLDRGSSLNKKSGPGKPPSKPAKPGPPPKMTAKRAAVEKELQAMSETLSQVYVEATKSTRGSRSASFATFDVLCGTDSPAFVGNRKGLLDLKTVRQKVADRRYKDPRSYLADIAKIASYATNAKKADRRQRFEAYQMVRSFHDEIQRRGLIKPSQSSRPPSATSSKSTEPVHVREAVASSQPAPTTGASLAKLLDTLTQHARKGVLKPGCLVQLKGKTCAKLDSFGVFRNEFAQPYPAVLDLAQMEEANCSELNSWDGLTVDGFNIRKLKWLTAKIPEDGLKTSGETSRDGKQAATRAKPAERLPLAVEAAAITPLNAEVTYKHCERIGYHTYDASITAQLSDACFACGSTFCNSAVPIRCQVCCEARHVYCIDGNVDDPKNWVCGYCRACSICEKGCHGQRADTLECDQCTKIVHRKCLRIRPSIESTRRRWLCGECVECEGCGRKTAGDMPGCQWSHDYTLCEECGMLRDKGNFCPMCNVLYRDDDFDTKMMCCDTCEKWLHISCVNIDDETYEQLSKNAEDIPFECPRCNPHANPTTTLKDQLAQRSVLTAQDEFYNSLQKVYQASRRVSSSWPFTHPTCRETFPDYDSVIPREIHMQYIEQQLANRKYDNVESFKADFEQMIENCLKYFGPERNAYTKSAQDFREVFVKKFAKIFPPEEDPPQVEQGNSDAPMAAEETEAGELVEECEPAVSHVAEDSPLQAEASVEVTPVEVTPVEVTPVEVTPVEVTPVEVAPVEVMPTDVSMAVDSTVTETSTELPNIEIAHPAIVSGEESSETHKISSDLEMNIADDTATESGKPPEPCELSSAGLETEELCSDAASPNSPLPGDKDDIEDTPPLSPRSEKAVTMEHLELLWKAPRVDRRACFLCTRVGDFPDEHGGRLVPVQSQGNPKVTPEATQWIHLNCALWSAEVYELENGEIMEVHAAMRRGKLLKCTECGLAGATVGCCFRSCKSNFHFACARQCGAVFTRSSAVYCSACQPKVKDLDPESFLGANDFASKKLAFVGADVNARTDRKKKEKVEQEAPPPLRVGCLAVHQYGVLQPQWPKFATENLLLPVGYLASRTFWSYKNPAEITRYFLSIGRTGAFPTFEIRTMDGFSVKESTLDAAWGVVLSTLTKKGWTESPPVTVDGVSMFGLSCPPVVAALEHLSFATSCKGYQFRFRDPLSDVGPRINLSGCARTEPYSKVQLASQLAADFKKKKGASQAGSRAPRPTNSMQQMASSMQYRQAKKVLKDTVVVKHSKIQGWGLFARKSIPKSDMIVEYLGELIRCQLCDKREAYYDSVKLGSYMFRIDDSYAVDATKFGGQARFVNHSCDPNCTSRIITVEGTKHIMIYALRDIEKGEELTYDYKFPLESNPEDKVICNCGAAKCTGFMN